MLIFNELSSILLLIFWFFRCNFAAEKIFMYR